MGVNNRQRRKAKQKVKQSKDRLRVQAAGIALDLGDALEEAVDAAFQAVHDGDQALLAEIVSWLSSLDGLADIALLGMMRSAVTSAWRDGWQPADLMSACGKLIDVQGKAMLADAIAAEMTHYSPMTVDELWQQQIATGVWWPRDDSYFTFWADHHGQDRLRSIASAIDVLHFMDHLPPLPILCPPPGKARRGSLAPADHGVDERMLGRVRGLLAKAESTEFPEEADALTSKAQELMSRYSIDYALLESRSGGKQEPGGRRITIDNPYDAQKVLLLDVVANANSCRTVWSREFGFSTVLGFPRDVSGVDVLFTSLLVQAMSAMRNAGPQMDGRTTSFRRSFLTSYAHRISQRLNEAAVSARDAAVKDYGGELLPVLVSRAGKVDAMFEKLFPTTTLSDVKPATNRLGWLAGIAAADRAELGHGRKAVAQRSTND